MEQVFTDIYEKCVWGDNEAEDYKGGSGPGSAVAYNQEKYIPFLQDFIRTKGIKTVVDFGCGDFRCGPYIYGDLDVAYTGYDAYNKVIEHNIATHGTDNKYSFIHLDFCNKREEIVGADLCILKDVLQHWPLADIYRFMDWLVASGKFKYVLIVNCSYQKQDETDVKAGGFRSLSCDFLPLKKYNPVKMLQYNTKEVSIITL